MASRSSQFELRGYNHIALVCADMQKTVDFYEGILGFELIKTLEFPGGGGQHFFFRITENDGIAFFYFPDAPSAAPGLAGAGWGKAGERGRREPGMGGASAPRSMHHLSFGVPAEKLAEYRDRLSAQGIDVTEVVRHAGTNADGEQEIMRSLYFPDPDGVVLEFAAWSESGARGGAEIRAPAAV